MWLCGIGFQPVEMKMTFWKPIPIQKSESAIGYKANGFFESMLRSAAALAIELE